MSHTRLLIVHPEPSVCALMSSMLQTLGHKIEEAPNDSAAVRKLEHGAPDLVLAAANPEDSDALEFLTYVRRKHPRVAVILLFSAPHPERSREAMLRGATAVLRYPLGANQLRAAVAQVLQSPEPANGSTTAKSAGIPSSHNATPSGGRGSTAEPGRNGSEPHRGYALAHADEALGLIGDDPSLRQAIELAGTIAPTRVPVLIVGERGTGKTLLARSLHQRSPRKDAPFVEISCLALKENVLEAELFGRKGEGGNEPDRPGKLAQAQGGTLVLDEVSALSPSLQFKLLRFLRDGEYEAVGSSQTLRADVRIIVTSREDLGALVRDGQFRQELYYRISVVTLKLPPLRHRGADIERLADHFRARFAGGIGKRVAEFSPEALHVLRDYEWPSNVQELEHVVERAVVVCQHGRIEPNHVVISPRDAQIPRAAGRSPGKLSGTVGILPLKEALEGPEKQLILQALEALNWNRQETARVLDINRTTLYKKMKKYGLLFDEPVWAN